MKYFKSIRSPRCKGECPAYSKGALFTKKRKFRITYNMWPNGVHKSPDIGNTMDDINIKLWDKYPFKLIEITKEEYEKEIFIAYL